MSRLVLVRHGESVANAGGWISGHGDAELTPRGVEQARSLRPVLGSRTFDRRVSSDLLRAVRTAELGWPHDAPPLHTHPELRERDIGDWEGVPLDELRAAGTVGVLRRWDEAPPGGESLRALSRRLLGWFEAHDDGSRMLVVVHGGVIRCLVGIIDGVPRDEIGQIRVGNVQVEGRDVDPASWARWRASL